MIFDSIENAELYFGLGDRIKLALEFIKKTDFKSIKEETVEIDGKNIFAMIQKYNTRNTEDAKWESHRKYIDIQYMIEGAENMGFVLSDYLDILEEYNEEKDVEFLEGLGDYMQINKGEFVVFFPDDAHMPGIKIKENEMVHKVVIKIAV